jgi:hypothetical protein
MTGSLPSSTRKSGDALLDERRARQPDRYRRAHGEWEALCSGGCGRWLPITREHWFFTAEGWRKYGRCKSCHVHQVGVERRARKRARRLALRDAKIVA